MSVNTRVGEPARSEVPKLSSGLSRPSLSCGKILHHTASFLQCLFLRLPFVVFDAPSCNYSMTSGAKVLKFIFHSIFSIRST